jgi:hypothetical protein
MVNGEIENRKSFFTALGVTHVVEYGHALLHYFGLTRYVVGLRESLLLILVLAAALCPLSELVESPEESFTLPLELSAL